MADVNITEFEAYQFQLLLREPLVIGKHRLTDRMGFIVGLRDENNHVAIGEVSPLPGLSPEDTNEVKTQLAKLRSLVKGRRVPNDLARLSGGFDGWLGDSNLAPSVRFGFEAAVLGLLARAKGIHLSKLLCDEPSDIVRVNALLSGSRETIMEKTDTLLNKGYRAFKLKVGRQPLQEDIELVREVKVLIGDECILRIDANRAWEIEQALVFAEGLAGVKIDYVEEPVKTLTLFRQLTSEPGMSLPLAIDESLMQLTPRDLSSLASIKAVVLKPTLFGIEKTMQFARSASNMGAIPVISSAFESGVGLGILAQIASSLSRGDVPAGLDTLDWFVEDLLVHPLAVEKGALEVSALPDSVKKIKQHFLQNVRHG